MPEIGHVLMQWGIDKDYKIRQISDDIYKFSFKYIRCFVRNERDRGYFSFLSPYPMAHFRILAIIHNTTR